MDKELKKGIVIVTSEKTKDFLADCINSCSNPDYPILVVGNNYTPIIEEMGLPNVDFILNDWNGFELGGIVRGMERFDEFILLHDTVIVKDQSIFDLSFNYPGAVYYTWELRYHYFAKYRTEVLKLMTIPRVDNLRSAIDAEEPFGKYYLDMESKYFVPLGLEPFMPCGDPSYPIVERHGRKGIIVSNPWLEKHKTNY